MRTTDASKEKYVSNTVMVNANMARAAKSWLMVENVPLLILRSVSSIVNLAKTAVPVIVGVFIPLSVVILETIEDVFLNTAHLHI